MATTSLVLRPWLGQVSVELGITEGFYLAVDVTTQ